MSILTREAQDKVVKLLVGEGLVGAEAVQAAQQEVQQSKQPILALLTAKKLVDDDGKLFVIYQNYTIIRVIGKCE